MLSQAGRNHRLRATPARRSASAKYGNPPTLGRPAMARFWAACRFSIALLITFSSMISLILRQRRLTQRPLHGAEHLIELRQDCHLVSKAGIPQRLQPGLLGADSISQALARLAAKLKLLPHPIGERAKRDSFVRREMPEIAEGP